MAGVMTRAGMIELATHGSDSLSQFSGAELVLIAAAFTPSFDTVLSGLTVATFTGYSAESVAFTAPSWDGAVGQAELSGTAVKTWVGPSDSSGQAIYGWVLYDGTTSVTLGSGTLAAPVSLAQPTDALYLVPELTVTGGVDCTSL